MESCGYRPGLLTGVVGGGRGEGRRVKAAFVCDVFLRIKIGPCAFLDARLIVVSKLGAFLTGAPVQAFFLGGGGDDLTGRRSK